MIRLYCLAWDLCEQYHSCEALRCLLQFKWIFEVAVDDLSCCEDILWNHIRKVCIQMQHDYTQWKLISVHSHSLNLTTSPSSSLETLSASNDTYLAWLACRQRSSTWKLHLLLFLCLWFPTSKLPKDFLLHLHEPSTWEMEVWTSMLTHDQE